MFIKQVIADCASFYKRMTRQCRTCAGVIYNRKAKNLFKVENADVLVNIELVSGTTLLNDPDLPTSICACCILDLNQAIVFRERCVKTQERFLQRRLWQHSDDDDLIIDVDADNEFNVSGNETNNAFDNVDEEVEDLLGFPEGDIDNNSITTGRTEEMDEDEDVVDDAETLIITVQKEMLSLCDNISEVPDAKTDNIDVVVSSSPSPIPKIIKKKSPGRPHKSTDTKTNRNSKSCKNPGVGSAPNGSTRKPYSTWKNLTQAEATQRKREQRGRDCVCEQCGRHFNDQSNFKLHMLRHTGVKNFACTECGKRFYTEHLMALHERIVHKGEKPYACKYCAKTFHNSTTRVIHERIHTNARPYSCEYCDKAFSSASGRKRHELVHTGIRSFYCATCEQPFQRSTHLKAHLKSKLHITRAARVRHLPEPTVN